MVFQKRLDCASNGFQIAAMPRFPRSAKGKRSARKKVEDSQMSAFDLLATLAGKLLAEREGFWTPSKERVDNESPFKGAAFDQGSCDESTFAPPSVPYGPINPEERIAAYSPTRLKSHRPQNGASGKNFFASSSMGELPSKSSHSSSPVESCVCKVDDGTAVSLHGKRKTSGSLIYDGATKLRNIEGPIDSDRKPPVLVSSDSSVEFPPYGDCTRVQSSFFPSNKDGKKLNGDKEDGENSSVCTYPAYIHSKPFKPHGLEAHRRKKLIKSSYRKTDPASFNDGEMSHNDVEMKSFFQSQKLFYTRQRSTRSSFNRRKLFDRCSLSPSCKSSRDETVLNSLADDGIRLEASNLLAGLNGANDISSTRRGPNSSYDSEDNPVKFSIKSFKVPELVIDIPANATVGSLKRTVMKAVMAIIGDGLRIGILFHGKKVRDDNKTLRQAGISYEDKLDNLGFTLEPSGTGIPSPLNNLQEPGFIRSDPQSLHMYEHMMLFSLRCGQVKTLTLTGFDAISRFQVSDAAFQPPPITIPTMNCDESDNDPPYIRDSISKVLVPFAAATSAPVLSVVPFRKSRRSEITQQRRIRRPFSVSEVQALVQAVERLGTGRWRDVKLQAFENAKHRTYVDLKDKWKTLVHTARISPQQRRGEPVPQELLDRVLSAHSYWSHQQAKLPDRAQTILT